MKKVVEASAGAAARIPLNQTIRQHRAANEKPLLNRIGRGGATARWMFGGACVLLESNRAMSAVVGCHLLFPPLRCP